MHSLHIDNQNGWRGGEQQAHYLVEGLRARGHQVSIAGRPGSQFLARTGRVDGVEPIALAMRNEFDVMSAWKLARYARRNTVDVLHAHTSNAHTLALLAQRFGSGGRVVVSRRVDFRPRGDWLTRWKYAAPDRIIAISEKIASILIEYGVSKDRINVVHSGIDPQRVNEPPLSRESLGLADANPLIGNVAALVGHKDHRTLIDAMRLVLRTLPNAKLAIAGEGELRSALEARIEELNLSGSITLLGYRDDIPAFLNALDLFVLSSNEEGLGTSVLDAMAAGIPVVATAAGGIPEMVHEGRTGLLSPPNDPKLLAENIVRMWEDESLRAACADNARELVRTEFSVEQMVEGNLAIYHSLLGNEP